MDPKFRSSFIPKKPLSVKSSDRAKQQHSFNLVVFISSALFAIALSFTGGMFLYENKTEEQLNQKGNELNSKKNSLDIESVEKYRALADRLEAASMLIESHKATSKLFQTLNEKTLHNVFYTDFSVDDLDSLKPTVIIKGQASGFNALSVQVGVFERENIIKNMKITGISLNEEGFVLFNITGSLVSDELLYTN